MSEHATGPVDDDDPEFAGDEITISPSALRTLGDQMQRFLLEYRFAMQEIETKLAILREEFVHMHEYNPIEHVSSRVKSIDSLVAKVERRGIDIGDDFSGIRAQIHDIAGVRITCSFIRDVYRLFDMLTQQDDITVLEVEDYIESPKPNGYKSLHSIISVPVYLSTGRVDVPVEVQFRTIAMDFWASLEHKIYYKYARQVPESLTRDLKDAAETAAELDARMERLHVQMHGEPAESAHTRARRAEPTSPRAAARALEARVRGIEARARGFVADTPPAPAPVQDASEHRVHRA